jgi:cellulose synthase/poly-beta-1,6-N-acetylglucosamine synthase-like glycosyltransferase
MIATLLSIGIFGILGVSVLCPLLAMSAAYLRKRNSRSNPIAGINTIPLPLRIEIILPAHNEALLIGATLASIQRSIDHLRAAPSYYPVPEMTIRVGADGCTDETSKIAREFAQVRVREFPQKQTKWITLKAMLSDSLSDWVILVDAGTIWPENFINDFIHQLDQNRNAIAIAPSYRPLKAGWLARIIWRVETSLKWIEAFSGGPVSLHGATVGYKTPPLKNALAYLGNTLWLNDDVVIPLILRSLNPNGIILYPVGEVQDTGIEINKMDMGRRKRMLLGNLQWAQKLWPDCVRRNPIAGMVAGRRLFRVLWAYWLAFLLVGVALAFQFVVLPGLVALGILMVVSGSFRQISGAALISLLTPFLMMRTHKQIKLQETWI